MDRLPTKINMSLKHILAGCACLMLLAFAAGSAHAGQPRVMSTEEVLKSELELMVKECKLSDEQQKTLKEKFKAKQDALEAWDKTNGDKMKTAQEAAATARKGTDADLKKKTNGEVNDLKTARNAAAAEADKAILAALSDEQKNLWAGAQLAVATLAKYKRNNPSEEQTAKIKAACMIAAVELAAFTGDDRKDKQGKTTVNKCLKWAIDNVIMVEAPKPAAAVPAATPAPAAPATPATPVAPATPVETK